MTEPFLDLPTKVNTEDITFRAIVEENGLAYLPSYLMEHGLAEDRAFIITDTNVNVWHGSQIEEVLMDAGIEPNILEMEAGEEYKTIEQFESFINQLSFARATRDDTVIAFGGGVVGDLGGYVASAYKRGVPLVHVPTTLLAMVDSSIGGKTAINLGGKNITGAFYQPKLVVADVNLLSTLDPLVYTEGFGEIAKYALLDAGFLPELEEAAEDIRSYSPDAHDVLGDIIAQCVKQKCEVVASDPFELNPGGRVLLNYGHTLAHGLEAAGEYTGLLHGEAVAVGMNFAAQLALKRGLTTTMFVDRQTALLQALGLPTQYEGDSTVTEILHEIDKDKKTSNTESTRLVLPIEVGRMVVEEVSNSEVEQAVRSFITTGQV